MVDQFLPSEGNEFSDLRRLLEHLEMVAKLGDFGSKHGPTFSTRMRRAHSIISRESDVLYRSLDAMQHHGLDSEHAKRSVYALLIAALNIGGAHTVSEAAIEHLNNIAPRTARSKKAAEDDVRIGVQKRIIADFIKGRNASAPTAFVQEHLGAINAAARKFDIKPGDQDSKKGVTYTASQNTWIARLKAVLNVSVKNQD